MSSEHTVDWESLYCDALKQLEEAEVERDRLRLQISDANKELKAKGKRIVELEVERDRLAKLLRVARSRIIRAGNIGHNDLQVIEITEALNEMSDKTEGGEDA